MAAPESKSSSHQDDERGPIKMEALQTILQKAEDDSSLKVTAIDIKMGSKTGDNYMSFMYSAEVKATKGNNPCSYSLMIKALPDNPARRGMLSELQAFVREVKQYTITFPELRNFEEEKGKSAVFHTYPRCFHAQTDGQTDHLILEDLRPAGFRMADRNTGLDLQHALLVMKELGHYHAVGYSICSGDPQQLKQKFPFLWQMIQPGDLGKHGQFLTDAFTKTMEVVESESAEKELTSQLQWLRKIRDGFEDKLAKAAQPKPGLSVITHGDFWVNNMMFRYEQGEPVGLKFVDFQFANIGSRANDLVFFILTSLEADLRRSSQEQLLEIYNESFVNHVKSLGVDASRFTLQQLKDDMKENYLFGFAVAVALLPFISVDEHDVPDMESMTEEDFDAGVGKDKQLDKIFHGKRYIRRVLDVISDSMIVM